MGRSFPANPLNGPPDEPGKPERYHDQSDPQDARGCQLLDLRSLIYDLVRSSRYRFRSGSRPRMGGSAHSVSPVGLELRPRGLNAISRSVVDIRVRREPIDGGNEPALLLLESLPPPLLPLLPLGCGYLLGDL